MSTSYHRKGEKKEVKKINLYIENIANKEQSFSLDVSQFVTIQKIKQLIFERTKIPYNQIQIYYKNQCFFQNQSFLFDYILPKLYYKQQLKIELRLSRQFEENIGFVQEVNKMFESYPNTKLRVNKFLTKVTTSLTQQLAPKLNEFGTGTSGSYFIEQFKKKTQYLQKLAIFKPFDEEPFTPNNPKNYIGKLGSQGFRKGILSGESAQREVAAYFIDQGENGIFKVPLTVYVEFYHKKFKFNDNYQQNASSKRTKLGSLQQIVKFDDTAADLGYSCFSIDDVHRIAILDLRILNCDRNDENILVQKTKEGYNLIPIDHGLSFPDTFQISSEYLCWYSYPQIKKEFTEKDIHIINQIDPKRDYDNLNQQFSFRKVCLRNFRIAEMVLKKGAQKKLTLRQICDLLYKKDDNEENKLSPVGEMVKTCENIYSYQIQNKQKQIILLNTNNLEQIEETKNEIEEEDQKTSETDIKHNILLDRQNSQMSFKSSKSRISRSSSLPNLVELSQSDSSQLFQNDNQPNNHNDKQETNEDEKDQLVNQMLIQNRLKPKNSQPEEWDERFYKIVDQQIELLINNEIRRNESLTVQTNRRQRLVSCDIIGNELQ